MREYELTPADEQRLKAIYRDPTLRQRSEYQRSVARGEGEVEATVQDNRFQGNRYLGCGDDGSAACGSRQEPSHLSTAPDEVEVLRGQVYDLSLRLGESRRVICGLWFIAWLLVVTLIGNWFL